MVATSSLDRDRSRKLGLECARWMDPTIGRWLSEDPSGLTVDADPYRYVRNDPTNLIDPSGLVPTVQIFVNSTDVPSEFHPENVESEMNKILAKAGVTAQVLIIVTKRDPNTKGDFPDDYFGIKKPPGSSSVARNYCRFEKDAKFPSANGEHYKISIGIHAYGQQIAGIGGTPNWDVYFANTFLHEAFWGNILGNADDGNAAQYTLPSGHQSVTVDISISPNNASAINAALP